MEQLLIEIGKAIGRMFLNPTLYWIILFVFVLSYKRIEREKSQFQKQIFPFAAELDRAWLRNLFVCLLISIGLFILNIHFTYEIVFIICVMIFLLSFVFGYSMLSASFSLGLTFLFFKMLSYQNVHLLHVNFITDRTFSALALLIGILLFVEARLYKKVCNESTFPEIEASLRGSWIGKHHIQKISFIPFFVMTSNPFNIPNELFITLNPATWEHIQFTFIPFIIGFHHRIYSDLPEEVAEKTGKVTTFLSVMTIVFATISFYLPGFAMITIFLAIIGRYYIQHRVKQQDEAKKPYFLHLENELKILAVIPNSPADQLGFKVGDTITKVEGAAVQTIEDLDKQLIRTITPPTFELLRKNNEIVHVRNEKFIGNLQSFGLLFTRINELIK